MASAAFTRAHRLLSPKDFKRVMDNPRWRASQRQFLLLVSDNDTVIARIGFVLPRRRIPTAVARNRVKRIIREVFRGQLSLLAGLDIVVMARDGLGDLDNPGLRLAIESQFQYIARKRQRPASPPAESIT